MHQLQIDLERCIGCRSCELVCALKNEGSLATNQSRIGIFRFDANCEFELPYIQIFVCRQCQDAPCLTVCPEDAIVKEDNARGTICVEMKSCTGCGLCIKACPFGGIQTEPVSKKAFKCELCGGEPACVDFCPSDALSFVDQEPFYAENFALQMKGISVFKRRKTNE